MDNESEKEPDILRRSGNDVVLDETRSVSTRFVQKRHTREDTRRDLALRMTWLITIVVAALLIAPLTGIIDIATTKELAAMVLSPLIGIVGIIIGFFFGSEAK